MAAKNSQKDREMAAMLKDRRITRETGMCPMGCGKALKNGGMALVIHLNNCKG